MQHVPPTGYKPLAWEGAGLFVPERWEIGRHEGDEKRGLFRVDDENRVVIQARWWTAERPIPIGDQVRQHAATMGRKADGPPPRFKPAGGLGLPAGPDDRAEAFLSDPSDDDGVEKRELLVIWQRQSVNRVLMARILIENGEPAMGRIKRMLSGLRLQGSGEPRDFAALDFAVRCPPGYKVDRGILKAGICYLAFRKSYFRSMAWRRFSAADAVMGTDKPGLDDLERWCRVTYANEFYDMRYKVQRTADPLGRPMLRLTGNRRWLAPIELKWLIPEHRRIPRRIDIVWDPAANKIYCVELIRPHADQEADVAALEASSRMTLGEGEAADEAVSAPVAEGAMAGKREMRQRSLRARVKRSPEVTFGTNDRQRTVLKYIVERPRGLRLLRLLGGLPRGPVRQERSLELDLIGTLVWEACGRESRVCEIIALIRDRFRISHREAELSVTEFVKNLGSRGLLSVVMEK